MKMVEEKKKDNIQFRIMYFIGIFMIVAGHCGNGSISLFYEWFPAYSFHLPLFIFVSGYFFINNREKLLKDFFKKILTKFIIPLYLWNLFYGIVILILHKHGIQFGRELSIDSLLILPIYNGHQFIFNLASWFIFPLIVIQVINIFFVKLINKREKLYYVHFIISLLLGFLGVILAMKGYRKDFLLLLIKVLYFIPFFSLGILYRVKLEKHDKLNNLAYFGIIFLIAYLLIYIFWGVKTYTPSGCHDFDNFYRPFIVGILGIAFWLRISRILAPALKDSKIVKYVSRDTFSIMMHHMTGFFVLNTFWLLLSKLHLIQGFDFNRYATNIQYVYAPRNLGHIRLFYVVFAIAFSLFVGYITRLIKNKLGDKIKIIIKKHKWRKA